eukprot:jgi/Galph1/1014/GphlegSOOS_G5746.1
METSKEFVIGNDHFLTKNLRKRDVCNIFQKAKFAEKKGDWELAFKLLNYCLEVDHADAHSWLALAKLRIKKGYDTDSNRKFFCDAIQNCPNNVHLLQAFAVFEHKVGNPEAARSLFQKGLELDVAWGHMEQRLGNVNKARDLFQQCLRIRPNLQVFIGLATLEARQGNINKSRETFQAAFDLLLSGKLTGPDIVKKKFAMFPKAVLYRAWANVEESFGNDEKAVEILSKAIVECPPEAETYFALSRVEVKRRNWMEARKLIQFAESLDPVTKPAIYNFWAILEEKTGNEEVAKQILEKASRLHKNDYSILQTWATIERRTGNIGKARELFQRSIDIQPNAPAFVAWALMEEEEEPNDGIGKARAFFELAMSTDVLHGATYNAYALFEARHGNVEKARKIFEQGKKKAVSPSILHGYAQTKYSNNIAKARALLSQGTKYCSEDTCFIWHSWGSLELAQKNYQQAIQIFERGLRRYSKSSQLWCGLALCFVALIKQCKDTKTGNTVFAGKAKKCFHKAVSFDPLHAHAWQAWGMFELHQGNARAARNLLKRGLRYCPSHVALWQALGIMESQQGNILLARKIFSRGAALPLSKSHVRLYHAWACTELRIGVITEARRLLEEALKCDRNHGPVWNVYGLLEEYHGSLIRAKELFEEGIKVAPNHVHLYISYALLESRQGNRDKALELFRKGFQIDASCSRLKEAFTRFLETDSRNNNSSCDDEQREAQKKLMTFVSKIWDDDL